MGNGDMIDTVKLNGKEYNSREIGGYKTNESFPDSFDSYTVNGLGPNILED